MKKEEILGEIEKVLQKESWKSKKEQDYVLELFRKIINPGHRYGSYDFEDFFYLRK